MEDNWTLESNKNGHYLGLIELVSEFNPLLNNHLDTYGNNGPGHTSYVSAKICEDLIEVMGKSIFESIKSELKIAKFHSIFVDSTPDVAREDQLTFTVRYVNEHDPIERFLAFIPIEEHGAEYLANVIYQFFGSHFTENKKNLIIVEILTTAS